MNGKAEDVLSWVFADFISTGSKWMHCSGGEAPWDEPEGGQLEMSKHLDLSICAHPGDDATSTS